MDRYLRRLMGGNFGRVVTVLVVVFAVTAAAAPYKISERDIEKLTDDQLKDAYKQTHSGPVPDAAILRKDLNYSVAKPQPRFFESVTKFRVNILNGLGNELVVFDKLENYMDRWYWRNIRPAATPGLFTAVAHYPAFKNRKEERGNAEVHYRIQGTDQTFVVSASNCKDHGGPCIRVKWNVDHSQVAVYPLDLVGVYKDGTFDIIIIPRTPGAKEMSGVVPWMQRQADLIGHLSLAELTLAGTHNSGSVNVQYPEDAWESFFVIEGAVGVWGICQDDYLSKQLEIGVRAFDLRIGQQTKTTRNAAEGKSGFQIVHGDVPMDIDLDTARDTLVQFIRANPKEIIILDFHSLEPALDPYPSPAEFMMALEKLFDGYILPYSPQGGVGIGTTLFEIWGRPNKSERIVISCKYCKGDAFRSWLWPDIPQKWFSWTDDHRSLEEALTDWHGISYLSEPHPQGGKPQTNFSRHLFSTCVFTNNIPFPPREQAEDLVPYIDSWTNASNTWTLGTNVFLVDFIRYMNNVAEAATGASMIKGWRKFNGIKNLVEPLEFTHVHS